jgi:hypothetical protein
VSCPAIRVPLQDHAASTNTRSRVDDALRTWDGLREQSGLGPWGVSYYRGALYAFHSHDSQFHAAGAGHPAPPLSANLEGRRVQVTGTLSVLSDVHVPLLKLPPCPTDEDELEDWNDNIAAAFEWVGMASLGAQR